MKIKLLNDWKNPSKVIFLLNISYGKQGKNTHSFMISLVGFSIFIYQHHKIKIMRELTGNYYFKQTWFGLVLMVEIKSALRNEYGPYINYSYVKAKPQDLIQLKLNKQNI